jgi:phosphoribosyl 1,2-cyclic phosphodiesterase
VEVTFWGVRGSIPTPGDTTQRWGGNSSCIEVRHEGLHPLVLDCGTGARKLGMKLIAERHRSLDMIFTHLHMDHVFGLPFFIPIYAPGYDVRITVPAFSDDEAREKLARYLNGVYHPTRLGEVPANVTFRGIRPGRSFDAGGYNVTGVSLNHPGGSIGYRIEADGYSIAYITDTAPFAKPGEGVAAGAPPAHAEVRIVEFLKDCDVVVYDTMYDIDEYLEKMTWGHSYPEYAAALCQAAGVKHLVLFHHLPDANDEALDALEAHWAKHEGLKVTVAREGDTVGCSTAPGVPA